MRLYRGYLPGERLGDVHEVVNLPPGAVDQPCLPHRPAFQTLVLPEVDHRERVAGVRVDRGQDRRAGGEVSGMTTAKTLPVPLRAPGQHPLRAHLPDDPHEILMQVLARMCHAALSEAEEPDLMHTQQRRGFLLLRPADTRNLAARNVRVESARIAISQNAIRHFDTRVCPRGDCAARPELGIVRVSDDHEYPLDVRIWQARHSSPPGFASRCSRYCTAAPHDTGPRAPAQRMGGLRGPFHFQVTCPAR
jgi:hypothetical protein